MEKSFLNRPGHLNAKSVCELLFGDSSRIVSSEVIEKGGTGAVVFVYDIINGEMPSTTSVNGQEPSIVRIVEKRTKNRREYKLSLLLKQIQSDNNVGSVFPKVYFANEYEGGFQVFMEFLQGASRRVPDIELISSSMVEAMVEVKETFSVLAEDNEWSRLTRKHYQNAERNLLHVCREMGRTPDEVISLKSIKDRLESERFVGCHNDFYWANLVFETKDRSSRCRVLDLGLVGVNYIGAELHHFARAALECEKLEKLYHTLVDKFAKQCGYDPSMVYICSNYYAFVRSIQRARRLLEMKHDVVKAEKELIRAERLAGDAMELCN